MWRCLFVTAHVSGRCGYVNGDEDAHARVDDVDVHIVLMFIFMPIL